MRLVLVSFGERGRRLTAGTVVSVEAFAGDGGELRGSESEAVDVVAEGKVGVSAVITPLNGPGERTRRS